MKSLERARKRARELRTSIGVEPEKLLEGILEYFEAHDINVEAVPADIIGGHEARLRDDGNLFYDERLDAKPERKLFVLAHELGHFDLKHKFTNYTDDRKLGAGSDYANNGAGAVARYHARIYEEAEADAFATEFLIPCRRVFDEWLDSGETTSTEIAARAGIESEVVRTQLAQGLFEYLYSGEAEQAKRKKLEVRLKPGIDFAKQRAAAIHTGSPALIDAGPGTGKTTTLVMRVDYLINELGEDPAKMLILTFSNEAAATLRSRIIAKVGEEKAGQIEINTFHGFGYSFLLKRGGNAIHPDTTIIDDAAQIEFIEKLLGSADCDLIVNLRDLRETAAEIARHINFLKQRGITPENFRNELKIWEAADKNAGKSQTSARDILKVYELYEKELVKARVVDFADLISKPVELMTDGADATGVSPLTKAVREDYRWIMVDEYQDVTRSVSRLLQLIAGKDNPPWVVGDARQSIYEFLGAHRENIYQFERDFLGAKIFELENNFRSSPEIIRAANQLANLMENPEFQKGEKEIEKWQPATLTESYGETPVLLAAAETQEAEYRGIIAQVKTWIDKGVPPEFIVVLARTNSDVANLAVALGRENITATVTGVLDTDGVAGDLVAAVAFADAPTAVLPRVIYALGRNDFEETELNEIIKLMIAEFETRNDFSGADSITKSEKVKGLIETVVSFYDGSLRQVYSADGFNVLCSFLFDETNYLRAILAERDETARNLALSEVVTVLTRAMSYRSTHPHIQPLFSRIGLSESLRAEMSGSVPSQTVVPPPAAGSVRIMTCHKAKGLEFPFVIVSGQSFNGKESDLWLPPDLKPKIENEQLAADSLLFVGVTRAQQAVVVSYAASKNAKTNTATREAADLLKRWKDAFDVPQMDWKRSDNTEASKGEIHAAGAVWGGKLKQRSGSLPVAALSRQDCALRVYLEDFVGVRFPTALWNLYPQFYESVRYTLEQAVVRFHTSDTPMTEAEAEEWFVKTFLLEKTAENPSSPLYLKNGIKIVRKFAADYKPETRAKQFFKSAVLDLKSISPDLAQPIRLSLVAHYEDENGTEHAVIFRPESLADSKTGRIAPEIFWSKIGRLGRKLAFLLLQKNGKTLVPWIYSGKDGFLYKLLWNQKTETTKADIQGAVTRLENFDKQFYEWQINEWNCGGCPCRISCPHWMKALPKKE